MKRNLSTHAILFGLASFACKGGEPPAETAAPKKLAVEKPAVVALDRIDREAFNRIAAELALPLFWIQDTGEDGKLTPNELAVLWRIAQTSKGEWVKDGAFTDKLTSAYDAIVARKDKGPESTGTGEEIKRKTLVQQELAQSRQTLIYNDFSNAPTEDKTIVHNILKAAVLIEQIHAKQNGVDQIAEKIPADDTMSRMLFYRNQGPWCAAPSTENEELCSAVAPKPKKISGLYPRSIQESDPNFCDTLAKRKDAEQLLHQFHVVVEENGELKAVPYSEAYKPEMEMIAQKLEAAAAATGADEAAFKDYLTAAAKAFRTNDWEPADEAWAKMNVDNSKWYLRIGPDETYFEPCSRKAGFHVSFAKINQGSREWQSRLEPVKGEMEEAMAKLAGKPYTARKVDFHLPDFIDIIVNAGDSRDAFGATIGQSLPNWGPVANEGRGRTVAMVSLYTDPDSVNELEKVTKSLLCSESMKSFGREPTARLMGTVLHEAAHNLGPAHEYQVAGKKDDEIFGGPLASMLEELKAETAAFYLTDWVAKKGLVLEEDARRGHVREVVWGFGHISRGMLTAEGKPKPYSQLAAIQLGWLVKEKAVEWKKDEMAANGEDKGCFELHLDKFAPPMEKLMATALGIKGRGDKKLAEKLIKEFVGDPKTKNPMLETITERMLRSPRASFVYAVDL
jgi:hypothetical protein